ncbi:hypothetical protein SMSP2_01934 [Limihaloglobus sulfuriphilus]|uniref:Uncharacterized protein n=1 Tax=Limihaloglobus sulfuriphilus TaxID=1851148 RepID=A0A1Q2MG77_9BACT|nr:hypothetical protein SMSP2_01934 [Limihaloglobus sulfuriphilus]
MYVCGVHPLPRTAGGGAEGKIEGIGCRTDSQGVALG